MTAYRQSAAQFERLAKHPSVSGKWAKDKGLWEGRRVAVEYLHRRGNARKRTDMRIEYGTLVLNDPGLRPDQIGLRTGANKPLHVIHVSRAKNIYDLTREK